VGGGGVGEVGVWVGGAVGPTEGDPEGDADGDTEGAGVCAAARCRVAGARKARKAMAKGVVDIVAVSSSAKSCAVGRTRQTPTGCRLSR